MVKPTVTHGNTFPSVVPRTHHVARGIAAPDTMNHSTPSEHPTESSTIDAKTVNASTHPNPGSGRHNETDGPTVTTTPSTPQPRTEPQPTNHAYGGPTRTTPRLQRSSGRHVPIVPCSVHVGGCAMGGRGVPWPYDHHTERIPTPVRHACRHRRVDPAGRRHASGRIIGAVRDVAP